MRQRDDRRFKCGLVTCRRVHVAKLSKRCGEAASRARRKEGAVSACLPGIERVELLLVALAPRIRAAVDVPVDIAFSPMNRAAVRVPSDQSCGRWRDVRGGAARGARWSGSPRRQVSSRRNASSLVKRTASRVDPPPPPWTSCTTAQWRVLVDREKRQQPFKGRGGRRLVAEDRQEIDRTSLSANSCSFGNQQREGSCRPGSRQVSRSRCVARPFGCCR